MSFKSLREVQKALSDSSITFEELVQSYLNKIEQRKNLNAFVEIWPEEALTQAKALQQKWSEGKAGKLAGMVIGIKDNICYKDHGVSASSKILSNFKSLYSSTVVERLLAADAIIIGRLNCDEFAMGSSNETSYYGPVLNPIDENRVPGGSSGGAATAVAADLCLAALGSDTGGSIRQPASLTGIVGFKPSYGVISRHGLVAYASSFDQIGPMTKCIEDAQLITEIISGPDEFDSTTLQAKLNFGNEFHGKPKIAYLKEAVENEAVHPEIRNRVNAYIENLRAKGFQVDPVSFPYLDYMVPTYYVLTTAEASSNLARFDGINYGYRSADAVGIDEVYTKSRTEGFGKEVKRRILLGTFVLSAGYFDAYYGTAQRVRQLLRQKTREIFSEYQLLLSPTCTDGAFRFGEKSDDPISMYMQDIFTVHAPLVGCPSISIPLDKLQENDMPYGIQFTAAEMADSELLHFVQGLDNEEL
ncbi:MAG: Asp-tRNA(Asn)/Glu-tRNA(Gln) amidotransferase subunit GatA [Bacteroidota bacterium]